MRRIPQLDGIRGLAIVMVVLCHYIQNGLIETPGLAAKYVAKTLSMSGFGVELFFVLSGFLICGILIDNKGSTTYFRTFYGRRTLRIFPLYLVLLASFLILQRWITPPKLFENAMPMWTYFTCTQNFAMVPYPGSTAEYLGVTWSLAVEEQFYLIIPLIVFLSPRRALPVLYSTGIAMAVALRFFFPGNQAYILMPWQADTLLSGALLAILMRQEGFPVWVARNRTAVVTAFGVLIAGFVIMTAKPWSPWAHNRLWLTALFTMLILVALTNVIPVVTRVLKNRVLMWFGDISYGLYLVHAPVNSLLHWAVLRRTWKIHTVDDLLVTMLAFCISVGLAALSFKYFESPIFRLGHKLKYARSAAVPDPKHISAAAAQS